MTNTNTITFDLAWYTILNRYSVSIRRKVCDAVISFAATGEIPVLKGMSKLAFELIANEISKQKNTLSVVKDENHQIDNEPVNETFEEPEDVEFENIEESSVDSTVTESENTIIEESSSEIEQNHSDSENNSPYEEIADDSAPVSADEIGKNPTLTTSYQEFSMTDDSPKIKTKPKKRKTKSASIPPQHKSNGRITCRKKGSKILLRTH